MTVTLLSARRRPLARSLAYALLTTALAVAPSAAQSAVKPMTPAQRRATLLNPALPFWKAKAPDTVVVDVETSKGVIAIELIREWAPHGVDHFYNLARAGFFDDTRFYRVIPWYIAQFGLAASPAVGAVWRDRKIRSDSVRTTNARGTLTYAQFSPRERTTNLFINLRDNPNLDTLKFAPIGRVIEGMEAADSIHFGYGELPSMPAPMGNPRRFYAETNRYLDKEYPKLDRIIAIKVRVPADSAK